MATGKVYLIGAGPGDVELLTLKAVRALAEADVILIDDLVNPEIYQFAKPSTELIHVGKRGGRKSTPQPFISRLMTTLALEGKCVARVKGGDPLIFARSGEELQALKEAGVEVVIVNGVTAGLAAAASLGVGLSHRDYCHSVTLVTGASQDATQQNWDALVQSGSTLVIYMGLRNIATIVQRLLSASMPPSTPSAVIENASLPTERYSLTTLAQLSESVKQGKYQSPAIIVVGDVLALAEVVAAGELIPLTSRSMP